jgi:hypothetical protein
LAGTLLFDEKILQKCFSILVWIAGCWNSLLTSRNPFLEHCSAEKIVVAAHANLDPNKQEVEFIFA